MGYSLKMVPFFTDDIAIRPHTATRAEYIERKVTIKKFCKGHPCSSNASDTETNGMPEAKFVVPSNGSRTH